MTANAQLSSASNEHYTPVEIIEAARAVMGGIDRDPATTDSVNRLRVKAKYRYTQAENGLALTWGTPNEPARVWLNPPGGKTGNKSNAAIWWARLVDQYLLGHVTQAVYLGFSIEILATSQDADIWAGSLPLCVPRQRIAFDVEAKPGEFVSGSSPTHQNVIVYLPPTEDYDASVARFQEAFGKFGGVRL